MADEQQGGAARQDLLDAGHRLGLERRIADGEGFVHDQDVGLDVHLHGEREPQGHARTVGLDRLFDVIADVGEGDDVVHDRVDAGALKAEDGAVDVDVLAAGQFRIEAGAQLQQVGEVGANEGPLQKADVEHADALAVRPEQGLVAGDIPGVVDEGAVDPQLPPIQHLLDAGLNAGLDLPFSCKAGVCCTCRAKVTEGEVVMDKNFTLEADEMAQGYVLSCQARATTKHLRISFDER